MKDAWKLCCVLVVAALSSCGGLYSEEKIPVGVYHGPTKIEALTVSGNEIEFRIRVPKGRHAGDVVNRRYKYAITYERHIAIIGSSNDSFLLDRVLNYLWVWDGKSIIRKNGGTVIFTR